MRWLITGASGQLGPYLLRHLQGEDVVAWSGSQTGQLFGVPFRPVDVARLDEVTTAFREGNPAIVIHAAALASVAACRQDPERAHAVNTRATVRLAEASAERRVRFVYVSTDLVFDGERGNYGEADETRPLSIYGRSKCVAEARVLACGGLVVRVSLMFGPTLSQRPGFFDQQLQGLRHGQAVTCFEDEWRTPLSLATAAGALVELGRAGVDGILHVGGPERLSRLEMGQRLALHLGAAESQIIGGLRNSKSDQEPRPRDVSLDSSRWRRLFPSAAWPTFAEGLREMLQ